MHADPSAREAREELLEALHLTEQEAADAPAPAPQVLQPNRAMRRAGFRGVPGHHAASKNHSKKRRKRAYGREETTTRGAIAHAIVKRILLEQEQEGREGAASE